MEAWTGGNHWVFQGNPKRYDLRERLKPGETEWWLVTRYATRIRPGDIVWFWRSGERALYGWGEVLSPPAPAERGGVRAQVSYIERFEPPIGLEAIRADRRLSQLLILRAPQGTNFATTSEEAAALVELARSNSFNAPAPSSTEELPAGLVPATEELPQFFRPFSPEPRLARPILQTVDVIAAIHDYGLQMAAETAAQESASPSTTSPEAPATSFARMLRVALTGSLKPGSATAENDLFADLGKSQDSGADQGLFDAGVSVDAAQQVLERSDLVLSAALAESIDRAVQIEAKLAAPDAQGSPVDIRAPALIAALLFSEWPAVKTLLVRLRRGRTVAELRERFLNTVGEIYGDEAVPRWRPFTRLGAADLVVYDYAPDIPEGDDALNIEPDVQAFASVIASETLTPPLSIGLFGDWGSGKSFFMGKVKEQVETLAKSARIPDPASAQDPDTPARLIDNPESGFLPNIVQIEFNAWHYVESNLWASLVVHLFENLRVDSDETVDSIDRRRKSLLKEMETAAQLRARAQDDREAAREQLKTKRQHLRRLQHARSQQRIDRSFKDILKALTAESCQGLLSRKAQAALEQAQHGNYEKWEEALGELNHSTEQARSLLGRGGRIWRGVRQLRWYNLVWLAGLVAVAGVLSFALPELIGKLGEDWEKKLGALAALAGTGAAWLHRATQKASGALDIIESAQARLNAAVAEWVPPPTRQETALSADLSNLENELKVAEEQVRQAAARAEAAEAGLVEIERTASLAHFIEERAASGDYREQLGILALIRKDFERLSKRMKEARQKRPRLPLDDPSRIDRIVLYIDDLDRCPAEKVWEVLQAIHLLLAFDLFVVVVGVDQRWLTRALALARAGLLQRHGAAATDTDRFLKRSGLDLSTVARPTDFLEKIFQVGFWLKPIDQAGFGRLLGGMLAKDQALRAAAAGAATGGGPTTQTPSRRQGKQGQGGSGQEGDEGALGAGNEPEGDHDITNARPEAVAIGPTEAEVMRQLGPIVGRSPRTAKRFVNLYRVLKAREFVASALNPLREAESLGGMTLLALVAGHPRGAEAVLKVIENAPEEEQKVSEFFVWNASEKRCEGGLAKLQDTLPGDIGQVLAKIAKAHLGDLNMLHLQRWLPTVRRFSFYSEIARDSSYADAFSQPMGTAGIPV